MFSDGVDVLIADLSAVDVDEDLLSIAELGTALRSESPDVLVGFLSIQTWLRRRLAEYLNCDPADIVFGSSEHGGPIIAAPPTDLSFNYATADGMAALVVGFRKAVGIDISGVVEDGQDLRVPVRTGALAQANGVSMGRSMQVVGLAGPSPVAFGTYEVTDISLGNSFVASVAAPRGSRLDVTILVTEAPQRGATEHAPLLLRLAAVGQ